MVADVSPSTTSVHLNRLKNEHLVKVFSQGKHRYYSLEGPDGRRHWRRCTSSPADLAITLCQAPRAGYSRHELVTITWRGDSASCYTTVLLQWDGYASVRPERTMPTT